MFKNVLDNEEERMKLIRDMLKTITKREEMVLRYYFGIENRRGTLTEIGKYFNITQNTVRRIKNKGILKMIHRVTKYEPFIFYFSSDVDKDLMKRCLNERKSKLLDEFMIDLLKLKGEDNKDVDYSFTSHAHLSVDDEDKGDEE